MLVKVDADLAMAFGTPISVRRACLEPGVNAGLERAVWARRTAEQGVRVSNVGGWQSQADLFDWPEPEVAQLGAMVDRAVEQFVGFGRAASPKPKLWKAGWANVNQAGDYNILHNHAGQDLAAVYYVKAPPENAAIRSEGKLELRDPRPTAGYCNHPTLFNADPLRIAPEPGMLVMFPSWVEHMVHPHQGPDERISIAINIKLMDFKS